MSQRLPELIEPIRMAETGRRLKGALMIGKMKRLAPLLFIAEGDDAGKVDVDLEFGVDQAGQVNIRGKVETELTLQCQRCMQALQLHIKENVSLAVVQSGQQANELPSHYEPLLIDEETASLTELVEDEILLALPSVPLHESDSCQTEFEATGQQTASTKIAGGPSEEQAEKKNPFAVLKELKEKVKE